MYREIDIKDYLEDSNPVPLIDVRSPGEFQKGRIPGAVNIPLFSNEERASVGTIYVRQSREKAIERGYYYVNPKLDFFIEASKKVAPDLKVAIHCWRGGMRSRAFAEHLVSNGFEEVYVIKDGYKAFRRHVHEAFQKKAELYILGGYTGSGKTQILKHLKAMGHQVIDLEGIARHKGSVFGGIGNVQQPTTEQFENNLFDEWKMLDLSRPVWLEDESQRIGMVYIPGELYQKMKESKVFFVDIPKTDRAGHLVKEYANWDRSELSAAIIRISKRLGGPNTAKALENLESGNFFETAMLLLGYYDKFYLRSVNKRNPGQVIRIALENTDHRKNAMIIQKHLEHICHEHH